MFVLNLGMAFGAGVYEARISVPRWVGPSPASGPGWHPDEARRDDTGRRFWGFTTTLPLTLLTLMNLWAGWKVSGPIHIWWLCAALAALADRVFTFSYFIPRMVGLLRQIDSAQARASASQWAKLNYIRLSFVLIAWLTAMEAFAMLRDG
jgi:hypothetical protein